MSENLGIKKKSGMTFEETVDRTKEVFKSAGFGAITEIDVKKVLKEKIDADFKKYTILGMCNPKIAMEALIASDEIGLLLPCNVCVYEDKNGDVLVNAVNPVVLLGIANAKGFDESAKQIKDIIQKAMDQL